MGSVDRLQSPVYTGVRLMFAFEKRWLREIFETVIPSGGSRQLPEGAGDVPIDGFVDDLMAHAPQQFRIGLRACTWLVMLSPLFVIGRPATFLALEEADRMRVLERFRDSDVYLLREMPLLFKTIGCLGFCGVPRVQARLGIFPRDEEAPSWARGEPRLPAGEVPPLPEGGLLKGGDGV